MDETTKVLHRLERIEALDRAAAPASQLLDELRALVVEAEAWTRLDDDVRARSPLARLGKEVEGMS